MKKALNLNIESAPPVHVQLQEVMDWLCKQAEEGTVLPFAQAALARVAIEMKYDDIDNQFRAATIASSGIPSGTLIMLDIAEALSLQKVKLWRQRVKDIQELKKRWIEKLLAP